MNNLLLLGGGLALTGAGAYMNHSNINKLKSQGSGTINPDLSRRLISHSNNKYGRELYVSGVEGHSPSEVGILEGDQISRYNRKLGGNGLSNSELDTISKGDLIGVSSKVHPVATTPTQYKILDQPKVLREIGTSTIAHELGHRSLRYDHNKSLPVVNHRLRPISKINRSLPMMVSGISGAIDGSRKRKGLAPLKSTKILPIAMAVLPEASLLYEEHNATKRGLRDMKRLGASKEELKDAKRNLNRAFRSYVGGAMGTAGLNLAAYGVGRGLGHMMTRK